RAAAVDPAARLPTGAGGAARRRLRTAAGGRAPRQAGHALALIPARGVTKVMPLVAAAFPSAPPPKAPWENPPPPPPPPPPSRPHLPLAPGKEAVMARIGLRALAPAALLTVVGAAIALGGDDANKHFNNQLAVQVAFEQGLAHLKRHDYQAAVRTLEKQIASI